MNIRLRVAAVAAIACTWQARVHAQSSSEPVQPAPTQAGSGPAPAAPPTASQGGQAPPPPGYGTPQQGYGQAPPPPGYGTPQQGYGQAPPPPGYGTPQQGYGQAPPPPGYGAPPPYGGVATGYGQPQWGRPAIIPYDEGDPMPPGYHLEDRIRKGPFVTGLAIGGAAYMLSVSIAAGDSFENQKGWLLLPAIGPWITLLARDDTCDVSTTTIGSVDEARDCAYEASSAAEVLLVFDGILQGTGLLLVTIGLAAPRTVLVRDDAAELVVQPVRVGRSGYGMGLSGSF